MAVQTFNDDFNTLNWWNGSSGIWQPSDEDVPNGFGGGSGSWEVNPFWQPTSAANCNPYSVSNSVLSLSLLTTPSSVRSSVNNAPFLCGWMQTYHSFNQLYGYFEMRAKMPSTYGINNAFWLMPEDGSWPPEIDIVEYLGRYQNTSNMTVHTIDGGQKQFYSTVPTATTEFNKYAVDWTAANITWYINDVAVATTKTPRGYNKPMYILLDMYAGDKNSWQGKPAKGAKGVFEIDYVRAWDVNPYH